MPSQIKLPPYTSSGSIRSRRFISRKLKMVPVAFRGINENGKLNIPINHQHFNVVYLLMRCLLLAAFVFSSICANCQSFQWWADLVKWDGVTPWQRYIKTFPKYLGPNGLPVPLITNGSIDS